MKPAEKFNALLVGVTVFVMFWLVTYLVPTLKNIGSEYSFFAAVGALLASVGLYRVLGLVIRSAMKRSEKVRKFVLGSHFVHGTWIGWFHGHNGEVRLMVEHFAQELDSLTISGRSYYQQGADHGIWISHSATIDASRGHLLFTYSFDGKTRSSQLVGIHSSLLERSSAAAAPTGYYGLAHDLNDQVRIAVTSKKVSPLLLSWREALALAQSEFRDIPSLTSSKA
jgi:uncharacterized membrane protein (Fun14 family)